jgi:hypothetical protein
MKLSKFLLTASFITLFSLLYVCLQAEIFRLGYVAEKSQAVFQDLLDKNSISRYNIERKASLVHIFNKVSECADFEMPATYRLVRLTSLKEGSRPGARSLKRENFVWRFFSIKRQAEAKTINP